MTYSQPGQLSLTETDLMIAVRPNLIVIRVPYGNHTDGWGSKQGERSTFLGQTHTEQLQNSLDPDMCYFRSGIGEKCRVCANFLYLKES